jgi:hypothetical protein
VDHAEEIRDLVRARMRRVRDAGLGDPDDAPYEPAPVAVEEAIGELLRESAALRQLAARLV